eukprot:3871158-Prymnesium_polylepis.1
MQASKRHPLKLGSLGGTDICDRSTFHVARVRDVALFKYPSEAPVDGSMATLTPAGLRSTRQKTDDAACVQRPKTVAVDSRKSRRGQRDHRCASKRVPAVSVCVPGGRRRWRDAIATGLFNTDGHVGCDHPHRIAALAAAALAAAALAAAALAAATLAAATADFTAAAAFTVAAATADFTAAAAFTVAAATSQLTHRR